jgi:DNA-directed RNA polymerase I, II, and III subunit RPABC3
VDLEPLFGGLVASSARGQTCGLLDPDFALLIHRKISRNQTSTWSHSTSPPQLGRHKLHFRSVVTRNIQLNNHTRKSSTFNSHGLVAFKMAQDSQLYADTFTLPTDPSVALIRGKYDRVERFKAVSQDNSTTLSLDINTDLFKLSPGESVEVLLASTLNLDGTKDAPEKGWRETGEATLADMWDYVCFGKVYRFEEAPGSLDVM